LIESMESTQRSYKTVLEQRAKKQLNSLSKTDYSKVRTAIDKLSVNPRGYNSIKLTDSDNQYRFRVSNFRILYTIADRVLTVYIIEILNRKDAYR
jgi:mRNA interferase RelE/StbE